MLSLDGRQRFCNARIYILIHQWLSRHLAPSLPDRLEQHLHLIARNRSKKNGSGNIDQYRHRQNKQNRKSSEWNDSQAHNQRRQSGFGSHFKAAQGENRSGQEEQSNDQEKQFRERRHQSRADLLITRDQEEIESEIKHQGQSGHNRHSFFTFKGHDNGCQQRIDIKKDQSGCQHLNHGDSGSKVVAMVEKANDIGSSQREESGDRQDADEQDI